MSLGKATSFKRGKVVKHHSYIQLKNGAVYRYNLNLAPEHQQALAQKIKLANYQVRLSNWTKVRAA